VTTCGVNFVLGRHYGQGSEPGKEALETMVAATPDVYNHNLKTVPRLYTSVRPGARYFHSLRLLDTVKRISLPMFTKSGLMVGLGKRPQKFTKSWMIYVLPMLISSQLDNIYSPLHVIIPFCGCGSQ